MKKYFNTLTSICAFVTSSFRLFQPEVSRSALGLFVAFVFSLNLIAQNIERKIIIKNGVFYYTTIDAEFQMATLHEGNVSDPIKAAKSFAMPAGRNYSDPIIPFCWDISGKNCFAVNWATHPMNDRNEALKLFPISELQPWSDKVTVMDMLAKSADYNNFTNNIPYMFVTKRSNTLENFFFDAVALNDSAYCMAICNKEEFSYWVYNGTSWDHIEMQHFPVDGYFSLFSNKQNVYMILSTGKAYNLTTKQITPLPEVSLKTSLADGVLIINKDDQTVKFIKNDQIDQGTPLKDLIKKKAVALL